MVGFRHLFQLFIFQTGCFCEESVVEINDMTIRTAVDGQGLCMDHLLGELLLDIVEQSPVAAAPAVDALFDITHDKVFAARMTHGF